MEIINSIFNFIWEILNYKMVGVMRAEPLTLAAWIVANPAAAAAAASAIGSGIGSVASSIGNWFTGSASIEAQKKQYEQQRKDRLASLGERGRQADLLGGQMPDLESIYAQYGITPDYIKGIFDPSQLDSAYDPSKLKEIYAGQRQLMGQQQAMQTSQAQSTAGAQAASRGLANPTAFTQQAVQPIQQAFAQQMGQLGAKENEALYNLGIDRFSQQQRMREGGLGAMQGLAGLLAQLRQQGFQNRLGVSQFRGQEGFAPQGYR